MQHSISNSKQVADLNSFSSGDIYLSSLGTFCFSVIIEFFSNISVLTSIIFHLVLFVEIIINLLFNLFSIFNQVFFTTLQIPNSLEDKFSHRDSQNETPISHYEKKKNRNHAECFLF